MHLIEGNIEYLLADFLNVLKLSARKICGKRISDFSAYRLGSIYTAESADDIFCQFRVVRVERRNKIGSI